jgi:hypothetical protein
MRENRPYGSVGGWGLITPRLPNHSQRRRLTGFGCLAQRGTVTYNADRLGTIDLHSQRRRLTVLGCLAHGSR